MANCVTDETDKRTHRETKYKNIKFKSRNRGEGKTPTTRNRKLHPRGGANATFFCLSALATHAAFVRKRLLYINKRGKKKLYKLYTNPTFNPAFRWFSARCEMYSLCFKLYTNYTQNPTLNPTQRRPKLYTEAFKNLHRTQHETSCWSLKSPSL